MKERENKDLKQIVLIVAMLVVGILLLGVMGGIAANTINFWLGAIIGFAVIVILIVLAMVYNKCRN